MTTKSQSPQAKKPLQAKTSPVQDVAAPSKPVETDKPVSSAPPAAKPKTDTASIATNPDSGKVEARTEAEPAPQVATTADKAATPAAAKAGSAEPVAAEPAVTEAGASKSAAKKPAATKPASRSAASRAPARAGSKTAPKASAPKAPATAIVRTSDAQSVTVEVAPAKQAPAKQAAGKQAPRKQTAAKQAPRKQAPAATEKTMPVPAAPAPFKFAPANASAPTEASAGTKSEAAVAAAPSASASAPLGFDLLPAGDAVAKPLRMALDLSTQSARDGYVRARESQEVLQKACASSVDAASRGLVALNAQWIDLMRMHSDATLGLWRATITAPSLSEAVKAQTSGMRQAYDSTSAQLKAIAETGSRVASETTEPLRKAFPAS